MTRNASFVARVNPEVEILGKAKKVSLQISCWLLNPSQTLLNLPFIRRIATLTDYFVRMSDRRPPVHYDSQVTKHLSLFPWHYFQR